MKNECGGWFKDKSWEHDEYDRNGRSLKRLVNKLFERRVKCSLPNVAMQIAYFSQEEKSNRKRDAIQEVPCLRERCNGLMEEFLQLSEKCSSERVYDEYKKFSQECFLDCNSCASTEKIISFPDISDGETPFDLASKVCEIVNIKGLAAMKSILGQTVVETGKVKVLVHNGNIELAGPGRYMKPNPRASWKCTLSLDYDLLEYETLKIIRIQKGYYGLAESSGDPCIFPEGILVRNTPLFTFKGVVKVDQVHIQHNNLHLLRIPSGHYGKVIVNNEWKLLPHGNYGFNSSVFQYCDLVPIDSPHIQHGNVNIIRVQRGTLVLVTIGTKPMILPEGVYSFNDPTFTLHNFKSTESKVIELNTRIRFRVNSGEIGLGWLNCKPLFIEKPGVYDMDSNNFKFITFVPAIQSTIRLGSSLRVIVKESQVGITYKSGLLDVLPPGTYMFEDAERVMVSFLTTQVISLPLQTGSDWILCDSRDFVQIGIRATVSFRVSDTRLAILKMGKGSEISDLIGKFSIASLQSIIRSTPLNLIIQNKTASVENATWDIPFFETFHDRFISNIHKVFKYEYGISIENIRVQDFKIMDEKLATSIANKVLSSTNNANLLANLSGQRVIDVTVEEIKSSINSMKSTSESLQTRIKVESKCQNSLTEIEAKAAAIIKIAKANAQARIYQAQAEATSIELKAIAQKKRAEYLESTEFGVQDALLNIHHDMVVESMKNISQVVYLPNGKNMGNLPIDLFGLKGDIPTFTSQGLLM